ncbi:MAG: AMP-dependent synthetase/ligase [Fastidiosipilaceae bacterium]|nr:AMP-binding protein [Clostridiaceae bacterium]
MKRMSGRRYLPGEVRQFNTLLEMLHQTADTYGSHLAYMYRRDPGAHVHYRTYGEFIEEIECLATGLIQMGLSDKHIGLLSENSYEWAVIYFAVANGVGVIAPFDAKLPSIEIGNLLNYSDVEAIFFSPKQLPKVVEAAKNSDIKYFICIDTMKSKNKKLKIPDDKRFIRYSDIRQRGATALAGGDDSFKQKEIDVDAPAALIFTSGTTSMAKGVMLSMRNLCANVMSATGSIEAFPGERVLSVLPLHHTFETTAGMLTPLYYGCCICVNDGLRHLAANLMEWSINILIAVPLLIENIYKRVDKGINESGKRNMINLMRPLARTMRSVGVNANRRLFRSVLDGLGGALRMIVVGAAATDQEVIETFSDFGVEFYQGYGLTEHSPIIAVTTKSNNVVGSVGPPLDKVELMIDDPVSYGDPTGEILVRSDSVMIGYYKDPEATAEVITDTGWLRTGDLGYLDESGSLHITGRSKSMIVLTNGKKAFPEEIEMYLNMIPGVVDSIVWGERNARDAVDICAQLQIRPSELPIPDKSDEDIGTYLESYIQFINKKMPRFKMIKQFVFTDEEMSRTTTMKVRRHIESEVIRNKLEAAGMTVRQANGMNINRLQKRD